MAKLKYILVLPCFLAACVAHHTRPLEGQTAQLRLISEHGMLMTARSYTDSNCGGGSGYGQMATFGTLGMNPATRRIGMPGADDLPYQFVKENFIPAGKPFVFSFNLATASAYTSGVRCDVTLTFNPTADQMYEAQFLIVDKKCTATMTRLGKGQNGAISRERESSFKGNETNCK